MGHYPVGTFSENVSNQCIRYLFLAQAEVDKINGSGAKIKLKTVEKVRDDVYQNEDIIHLIALILIMEYHMWASTRGHSFRIGKS